ncbi:5-oxoprolinase subunit C family protein [Flavilitoribacter nigricans]|uniref:KipI antagonist n=1 Tax=Flavilitoribacter nigricans (strain ATCC 23147 / DSM 23189 / NBRC 102662 / NCIMB 1420 / SS-2) TaxID=1122177 RepID=A0A2D0N968_FLAN2|nr:biotin-dependent carboxyltransferase family protein [Flavilitoribacter nigricans]PHN04928.1 KipI antagonist [Flavilitoribacter nigricans DSM 23189 = NBRC 102662]
MKEQAVTLQIIKSGLLTLVQDGGRLGQQAFGLPTGGVMDRRAAATANWLTGQPEDYPVLEITLQGPEIQFDGSLQIAITGADLSPTIDEVPVANYQTLDVKEGQTLRFGAARSGCRAYLAIRGRWQIKEWLGSFSGLAVAGKYWPPGSRLEKDTRINIWPGEPLAARKLSSREQPHHSHELSVRVMEGPEVDWFPASAIQFFTSHAFTVGPDSNRMGYRLRENLPDYQPQLELISSGIVPGTIQVLPAGNPVVLLADAQTSGGYPRLGNVLSRDLDFLAQLVPGDRIRFVMV